MPGFKDYNVTWVYSLKTAYIIVMHFSIKVLMEFYTISANSSTLMMAVHHPI
jgi:ATP-dependent Clp protease adapter protein ClpS